jgi:hypothetical protein
MRVSVLGALLLGCALPQWSNADTGGLQTSVAVDLLGKFGSAGPGTQDRFEVREAEVTFFAPIDPLLDGALSLAAHPENGQTVFEVHEAYLQTTRLIPRSRIKLGQFFLGIGRLNQFHRHDWPFVSAPKVHREFLGEEAVSDAGLEYGYLLPLPFVLDFSIGLTSGWTFGHTHTAGSVPQTPTHYLRLMTYTDLPGSGGLQVGINYLGRKRSDSTKQGLVGLDATAKWQEGRRLVWLIQSETWWRLLGVPGADLERALGTSLYTQHGLTDELAAGVRFDAYTILSLADAAGTSLTNGTWALVPTLTYKPSEFSTLRAAYTFEKTYRDLRDDQIAQAVELQFTFILGTHPAHDF